MATKRRLAMIFALLLVLATAGCGGTPAPASNAGGAGAASGGAQTGFDLAALENAAKAEGALTFYITSSPAIIASITKAFAAKYGFTPQLLDFNNATMKTKVQTEVQSGQLLMDLFQVGERSFIEGLAKDLSPINDLPSWAAFPEKFKGTNTALVSVQEKGLIYNTNTAKASDITSWTSLTDARWKSQIAFGAASTSISTALAYVDMANEFGDAFVEKLVAQDLSWQFASGPILAIVGSGEKAIGYPVTVGNYQTLKKTGAPIGWIDMDPQSGAEQYIAIPAKAKNPSAARLMANFLLSPEGQQAMNGNELGASVLPNIPGTVPLSKGFRSIDESIPASERERVLKALGSP